METHGDTKTCIDCRSSLGPRGTASMLRLARSLHQVRDVALSPCPFHSTFKFVNKYLHNMFISAEGDARIGSITRTSSIHHHQDAR
ncbi:Uncharacterized protein DAT39_005039 [Clarias magur]|uniref:Uncharacterized protein n=1 Tax=Clarias magur TaxID=1594786 RepID=A0A8J4TWJ7_CLAMG|nr:Uncharacterized protein DAT39_005039 [Clarias magur]